MRGATERFSAPLAANCIVVFAPFSRQYQRTALPQKNSAPQGRSLFAWSPCIASAFSVRLRPVRDCSYRDRGVKQLFTRSHQPRRSHSTKCHLQLCQSPSLRYRLGLGILPATFCLHPTIVCRSIPDKSPPRQLATLLSISSSLKRMPHLSASPSIALSSCLRADLYELSWTVRFVRP